MIILCEEDLETEEHSLRTVSINGKAFAIQKQDDMVPFIAKVFCFKLL